MAVDNRQERVLRLIYEIGMFNSDDLVFYFDDEDIELLELAAKKAESSHLGRVSGAVFQMHRELSWFKVFLLTDIFLTFFFFFFGFSTP